MYYLADGNIKIRDMVKEDAYIIYNTYLSYNWHPVLNTYLEYYKETLQQKRKVFIAEYNGKVKGLCTLVLEPEEGPYGGMGIPEIVDLCVFLINITLEPAVSSLMLLKMKQQKSVGKYILV